MRPFFEQAIRPAKDVISPAADEKLHNLMKFIVCHDLTSVKIRLNDL